MGLFDAFKPKKKTTFEKLKESLFPEKKKSFLEKVGDGLTSVAKSAGKAVIETAKKTNEEIRKHEERYSHLSDDQLVQKWNQGPVGLERTVLINVIKNRGLYQSLEDDELIKEWNKRGSFSEPSELKKRALAKALSNRGIFLDEMEKWL